MRRLFSLALALALASCTVDTEGAACAGDTNCPAEQRCGHAGTCSVAAAACQGEICHQHECSGQTRRRCVVDGQGPCAHVEEVECSSHQDCNPADGTCDCKETPCLPGLNAYCGATGERLTCAVDGDGCRYVATSDPCPTGQTCGGAPDAICACPDLGADVEAGCGTPTATSCLGSSLLRCVPKVEGSACHVWRLVEDCSLAGLPCDPAAASPPATAACACPPHLASPVVLHADPGAATRPGLVRNGALEPSTCRFTTLGAALAATSSGATVKAVGYLDAPVVFTEGPITVPAGVSVTTGDAPLDPGHYVLEPSAAVGTSAFVSLRPGASLSGVEIRNAAATGAGVETNCAAVDDTATVTVDGIIVTGLGTGPAPPRFSYGLRHTGRCSMALTGTTVGGASDTGVLISSVAAASTLTMTGNVIQGNQGGGTSYAIGPAPARRAGGIGFVGTLPGNVVFRANKVLGNGGDQVLVFSTGTLDLSRAVCGADVNVIACYATGVGLSSKAGTVRVGYSTWSTPVPAEGIDYLFEAGATITGLTETCSFHPAASCP
jgi:hypothetical protein